MLCLMEAVTLMGESAVIVTRRCSTAMPMRFVTVCLLMTAYQSGESFESYYEEEIPTGKRSASGLHKSGCTVASTC
jgi:hypothetical protein